MGARLVSAVKTVEPRYAMSDVRRLAGCIPYVVDCDFDLIQAKELTEEEARAELEAEKTIKSLLTLHRPGVDVVGMLTRRDPIPEIEASTSDTIGNTLGGVSTCRTIESGTYRRICFADSKLFVRYKGARSTNVFSN